MVTAGPGSGLGCRLGDAFGCQIVVLPLFLSLPFFSCGTVRSQSLLSRQSTVPQHAQSAAGRKAGGCAVQVGFRPAEMEYSS